jgi:hypothetical protein
MKKFAIRREKFLEGGEKGKLPDGDQKLQGLVKITEG